MASKRTSPTQFTRESAERIARVVRAAELSYPQARPLEFPIASGQGGRQVRLAKFTGSWAINTLKTITFASSAASPPTALARNVVCGLNPLGECQISVGKAGAEWFLIQPNLSHLRGYSTSGTQVIAIVSGNLQFVGTTAC